VGRSYYHLVYGLIDHLQARGGDDSSSTLTAQDHQQAIRFDESNLQAHSNLKISFFIVHVQNLLHVASFTNNLR